MTTSRDQKLVSVTTTPTGVRFAVRVQPRASVNAITGAYGSSLKVRLTAPPVDGAANNALAEFLADELGVARRAVTIISGLTSRSKVIEIEGVTAQTIHRLAGQPPAKA